MSEVKLYHLSRDITAVESFIQNGGLPIGKSWGGQADGFYCLPFKFDEGSYLPDFLRSQDKSYSLLITVATSLTSIKYPEWQIDVTTTEKLGKELGCWRKQILKLGKIPATAFGRSTTIRVIDFCNFIDDPCGDIESGSTLTFQYGNHKLESYCGHWYPENCFGTQAVVEALCQKHPDFLERYNTMLQEIVQEKSNDALKYIGKAPLPVFQIEKLNLNTRGIVQSIEPIYQAPQKISQWNGADLHPQPKSPGRENE